MRCKKNHATEESPTEDTILESNAYMKWNRGR